MGEKSLHTVGRGIFQMEEAKKMGPDDSNESRHTLPMGVGNDKRVVRSHTDSQKFLRTGFHFLQTFSLSRLSLPSGSLYAQEIRPCLMHALCACQSL